MTENSDVPILTKRFVLIADDDLDDQELLGDAFKRIDSSLRLEFIHNGNKLLLYLESLKDDELPSLVILDYNMPELNGVEILRALSVIPRYEQVPKIVWSTSSSVVFKNLSFQLGAIDYIVKPSDLASFEKIARHLITFIK